MNIEMYAKHILFSSTIEDKLLPPDNISDALYPPLLHSSFLPGRPKELAFDKGRHPFPSSKEMESPQKRGEALLFFANHELLAIELMALFILRFPNSPVKLRRGILHIIKEEQSHLVMYLRRAKELGAKPGQVPVNRFFWDALHKMTQKEHFISAMGLTFEQANLDHCIYYGALFHKYEDIQSASIMQQVYEDEIRHVRHGYAWSTQLSSEKTWDFHMRHLLPPLTPARAKGRFFDIEGRKSIGFSDEYIQKLQNYNSSKGRIPAVWVFNAGIEQELYTKGRLPKIVTRVNNDLAILLATLCKRDDILHINRQPSPECMQELVKLLSAKSGCSGLEYSRELS